jgi:hypothetical protein
MTQLNGPSDGDGQHTPHRLESKNYGAVFAALF